MKEGRGLAWNKKIINKSNKILITSLVGHHLPPPTAMCSLGILAI